MLYRRISSEIRTRILLGPKISGHGGPEVRIPMCCKGTAVRRMGVSGRGYSLEHLPLIFLAANH